jgi:hypothetical protein
MDLEAPSNNRSIVLGRLPVRFVERNVLGEYT